MRSSRVQCGASGSKLRSCVCGGLEDARAYAACSATMHMENQRRVVAAVESVVGQADVFSLEIADSR
eukprot:4728945-Lingulodinium_polyedra.AAC.1